MIKKTSTLFIFTLLIILSHSIFAQNESENWDVYMASYDEGKPGSTTVRMDLIDSAPFKDYEYILITGISYESEREDGLPNGDSTFKLLYSLGDALVNLLDSYGENISVGSFTYNFERLEYFYLKSKDGIEEKINDFYTSNYPEHKYYLNIKEDKDWSYYKEFLYPNDETLNYMSDQKVVMALQEASDKLTKARRVDHWVYFDNKSRMEAFKNEVLKQGFEIEFSGKIDSTALPFQCRIFRVDYVGIDSIYSITSSLRKLAKQFDGDYDGWETSVETD